MKMLFSALVLSGAALRCAAQGFPDLESRSVNPCDALDDVLPNQVVWPNTTEYAVSNTYWSARQTAVEPSCFLLPASVKDVSKAVQILTSLHAPFSVKSGGHTAFPSGSNVQDGVTIDLARLDAVTVSANRKAVTIGAGTRWLNVSQQLDPLGLAVVGGRVSDVGVAGLVLGGGISFLSGRHGWACDNVRKFEIAIASGAVVQATPKLNSDLYRALRGGGGSSFGIVTSFELDLYEQGDIWHNNAVFSGEFGGDLVPAFVKTARDALHKEPDAHMFMIMTYVADLGGFIYSSFLYHLKHALTSPEPEESFPKVYEPLKTVPGALINDTFVANTTAHSLLLAEPYGMRKTWWDTTLSAKDPTLFTDMIPLFEQHAKALVDEAGRLGGTAMPILAFQPISENIIKAMRKNGGNSLGLDPHDGPLMIVQVTTSWTDPAMDGMVETTSEQLIGRFDRMAKKKGLAHRFRYMNYAGKTQDVFAGYGEANRKHLKRVAKKVDPKGMLKKLWRGYFRVD